MTTSSISFSLGKKALQEIKSKGLSRRLVMMEVDANQGDT